MTKILQKIIQYTVILGCIYSASVLSFVWWHCYTSPLQGGKNGPLDAYRHTLASAVVSYTTSPKVVSLVTLVMEHKNKLPNLMDRHNNAIGAQLGTQVNAFAKLDSAVKSQIATGTINSTLSNQTTWLPKPYWGNHVWW